MIIFSATDKIASVSTDGDIRIFQMLLQCENCEQTFTANTFDEHICEYSDRDTFIYDDAMMNFLWEESSLRKMYLENNKVIQQILEQRDDSSSRSKDTKKATNQAHYVCSVCHRMYVHASGLARHMETQHNSNDTRNKPIHQLTVQEETMAEVIKCLVCGQIFNSLPSCFAHLKLAHAEYGFNESEISLMAGDALLFEKLKLSQCFQCEFCDFLFADTSALFQHKMAHDLDIGYECSSCELASRNLKFILNHRNNECPYEMYERQAKITCKSQFVCSECETPFELLGQLYEHRYRNIYLIEFLLHLIRILIDIFNRYLKKHYPTLNNRKSRQNEYFCEKCGEQFGLDMNALELHTETVHTKKGRTQNLPMTSAVRPYLCEVCGKGYTQSSHLYQHLRFHKGNFQ